MIEEIVSSYLKRLNLLHAISRLENKSGWDIPCHFVYSIRILLLGFVGSYCYTVHFLQMGTTFRTASDSSNTLQEYLITTLSFDAHDGPTYSHIQYWSYFIIVGSTVLI